MVVGYILLGWLGWAWAALGEGGQYNGTHALCTSDLLVTYNVEIDRLDYVVLVYVHTCRVVIFFDVIVVVHSFTPNPHNA